ncbi:hypothetical protein ACFLTR_02355 [Chloroflexota bacterium]
MRFRSCGRAKAKIVETDTGFVRREVNIKPRKGEISGQPAIKYIDIDRTSNNITIKKDFVSEQTENGGWKIVHEDPPQISKAKHRPQKADEKP